MTVRRALLGFAAITALYLVAIVWVDSRNRVFSGLAELLSLLPLLAGLSMIGYLARFARWQWLLRRAGARTGHGEGFLAYLSGFAFTATPGKVGELVRIRYLERRGVPPPVVLGAFVFERALDLLVVLALALLAVGDGRMLALATVFVAVFVGLVAAVAWHPGWTTPIVEALRGRGWTRPARLLAALRDGLAGTRRWLTGPDLAVGVLAGVFAWSLTAAAFVWLVDTLGARVPTLDAFAAYPLAMLAGAASMLPGGVGSTELAIVALMARLDVPLQTATLAAVGIRLSTLWFSILCGLVSVAVLEAIDLRVARRSVPNRTEAVPPAR